MLKPRLWAALVALAPLLAHAGLFDDKEARQQIAEQQKRIEQLQQQLQQADQQLSDRVARSEEAVKGLKLTEVLNQLEAVRNEMAALRGQFELQTYQIEQLQKRQKDLYNDIDTRVRTLESGAGTEKPVVADKNAGEETAYSAALDAYKKGQYGEAASGFQSFAGSYPESRLVPNALFWSATAQYAQKDCKAALATYQKLLGQFPDSSKTPDALLGVANCQTELKDTAAARKTLQQLINRFPATPAGEQAKKQLAELGGKGGKK